MIHTKRGFRLLIAVALLNSGLFALSGVAQEPVTLGLDTVDGLIVDSPGGYTQAGHSFGSVPVRNGEPAQGLTVMLSAGDGLVFYGPPVETGPGEVVVECTVWCTGPDVGLALVAMNLPDYSMMANMPASGADFLEGWHSLRLVYDPRDDSLMLGFQVVSKANPDSDVSSIVYIDEITVTPLNSLTREEAGALLGVPIVDTPTPTMTPTHTETAAPTATPLSVDTHTSGVTSVAFSHDGTSFLTAGKDRTAKLWDAATGELLANFSGHKGVLQAADITPDGQFVVTASLDTTARVWNAETGQYIRKFTSHRAPVLALAISPSGGEALTGGGDNNARLWSLATVQEIQVFTGHREDVTSVAFSSDGQRMLTGSADWTARLWNRETGEAIRTFIGHSSGVTSVALSSDGSRVFTASEDGSARVWDASNGETVAVLEGYDSAVRSLALSSNDAWVLTGGDDQTVKLWHAEAGAVRHTFTGHSGAVNGVAFSPDGGKGLSGSEDGTVQLWALSESYTTPTPTQTPTLTHTPTPTFTQTPTFTPTPTLTPTLTLTPTPTETATPGPGLDDGFESGDLLSAAWSTAEYQGWFVTSDNAAMGISSARSGQIFDGQNSIMEITVSVDSWRGAALAFQRRVSSEPGHDYLNFYIDGVLKERWSGEVPWGQVRYAIEPGTHTLSWTFVKDGSSKHGEDAAYIDDAVLLTETVTAGLDVLGGFEEGYLAGTIWTSPTDVGWTITSEVVGEGVFSARSGRIADGQSTTLETTITVAPEQVGFISFLRSVSCETEYDYLSFSIDGIEKGQWSGEVPWALAWYRAESGTHTLRWTYTKDFSNGHGHDVAYIDQVRLLQAPEATDVSMVTLPYLPEGGRPLQMVLIPAGTFTMGSPGGEQGREADESPQHTVTISQPFYIGMYEVTQAQWEALMGGSPSHNDGNPNHPVEQVSWNDCQDFIQALNGLEQGIFRLPTEAEWEYACRAGTTTRYHWGEDPQDAYMSEHEWYYSNSSGQTQSVGQKLPNPWGLHDMGGNVVEWCLDRSGDYPSGHVADPSGPSSGTERVNRGSYFGSYGPGKCRSANRSSAVPGLRHTAVGFRVVREFP